MEGWLVGEGFRVLVVLGFRVPWRAPDPRHSSWCPEKTPRSCNASSGDPPIRDPALSWKHKPPLTTIAIRLHGRPCVECDLLVYPLRVHDIGRQWKISVCNLKRCWNNEVLTIDKSRGANGIWSLWVAWRQKISRSSKGDVYLPRSRQHKNKILFSMKEIKWLYMWEK